MESACFISLWPINGDAITVMEMDCCCQQTGLRAFRGSFPPVVGVPTVRENFIRSACRIPPGEALRPSWRGGGRGSALGSGRGIQGAGCWQHVSVESSPKGSGAGWWPGSGPAHHRGLILSPGGKEGRKLRGQNNQCPLDLLRPFPGKGVKSTESEPIPSILPQRGTVHKDPRSTNPGDWATHYRAAIRQHENP